MGRGIEVPVTPEVLRWALEQSGFDIAEIAARLKISAEDIQRWLDGTSRPLKSKFDSLARILRRPTALFFLPEPPETASTSVSFRHPASSERQTLNPKERQVIREIGRIQRTLTWVREELGDSHAELPRFSITADAEKAAQETRTKLGVSVETQLAWKNSSEALREWRTTLEDSRVLVFRLPMGRDSIRGFSLFHQDLPAVAVNTWWNNEARIFSLLHEYGHLLTRTSSACLDSPRQLSRQDGDVTERWCERFAAAVLLPWQPLESYAKSRFRWSSMREIHDLDQLYSIARKFKTSARATALRLIQHEFADWSLYWSIPAAKDTKSGGGGGSGRSRLEIRRDEYGEAVPRLFVRAVDSDLMERTEALSYLRVSDSDFDTWRT